MLTWIVSLSFFISNVAFSELVQKHWKDRHAEGWAWYHDRQQEVKEDTKEEDPIATFKQSKEELDNALSIAMLEPTKENVLIYMILQKQWLEKTMLFSQEWKKIALNHPELASHLPTNQYGVQVKKDADNKARIEFIRSLAKQNTLLFFYEGKSPFSQAFSQVVKDFASEYKWSVKAISMDGAILRDFPQSMFDESIAKEMDVKFPPALYAVNIITRETTPIAYGMATMNQIEENISMQLGQTQ